MRTAPRSRPRFVDVADLHVAQEVPVDHLSRHAGEELQLWQLDNLRIVGSNLASSMLAHRRRHAAQRG